MLDVQSERATLQRRSGRTQEKAMNTPLVYHAGQADVLVRQSRDYSKFHIDPINRNIDDQHVERLFDAISAKNLLAEYPILVDSSMRVIDGQHRLMVAELLEVPIYYIVTDKATVNDAAITNANTKHWTTADYMARYVAEGKEEYVKLHQFMEEFSWMNLSVNIVRDLCYYGDRSRLGYSFNMGLYKCNDIPFARRVMKALVDFSEFVPFYRERIFIVAVTNLLSNAKYEHRRMMRKIAQRPRALVKCTDVDTYFEVFNEIYNYGYGEQNRMTLKRLNRAEADFRVDRKILDTP